MTRAGAGLSPISQKKGKPRSAKLTKKLIAPKHTV
jgi:hypothetical protein